MLQHKASHTHFKGLASFTNLEDLFDGSPPPSLDAQFLCAVVQSNGWLLGILSQRGNNVPRFSIKSCLATGNS